MFDEILSFVKEHLGGHPALANVSAQIKKPVKWTAKTEKIFFIRPGNLI